MDMGLLLDMLMRKNPNRWGINNSLWPSDAVWWCRSGSILAQVMACCLTAPSHYLNQCWLIINKIQSSNNHLRVISHEVPQPSITKIILKITCLKFHSNLSGANKLTHYGLVMSSTVETLYNTVNFCWSTHKRHSIARPKGRGMGCLLWVQRATCCIDLSKLSSIKYLL